MTTLTKTEKARDRQRRAIGLTGFGSNGLDFLDDVHAFSDGSEDAMLAIQPGGLDGAEEELRSVGIGSSVGHGQDTGSSVLEGEVLIGEFLSVDGFSSSSVALGEITSLAHEVGDDTVKGGSLEAKALLSSAQGTEVLSGLGNNIGSQFHDDAAGSGAADGHVEVNSGVRSHFE